MDSNFDLLILQNSGSEDLLASEVNDEDDSSDEEAEDLEEIPNSDTEKDPLIFDSDGEISELELVTDSEEDDDDADESEEENASGESDSENDSENESDSKGLDSTNESVSESEESETVEQTIVIPTKSTAKKSSKQIKSKQVKSKETKAQETNSKELKSKGLRSEQVKTKKTKNKIKSNQVKSKQKSDKSNSETARKNSKNSEFAGNETETKTEENIAGKSSGENSSIVPDEYEFDSSDEEDIRNTIGNVPMKWYDDYPHLGYNWDGQRILKPEKGDQLDNFLKRMEDPDFWRTIKDPQTGQDVVLSEADIQLITRIQKQKVPDAQFDEYAVSFLLLN